MMLTRFPRKRPKRATWALVMASGLCAHTASAGGFQVFAHGAKAVGSAYAQQASTDDASSAWWNPAAYGFADHAQLGLAVHVLAPEGRFTNQGSTTYLPPPQGLPLVGNDGGKLNDLGYIGNLYYTQPLNDRISIGLALTEPFGLSTRYDSGWVGRYYATDSTLTTIDIGPSLSIKATDRLRLGVGVDAQYAKASLSNAIDFSSVCLAQAAIVPAFALQCAGAGLTTPGDPAHDGKANLSADSWGWGWNLSAAYAPRAGTLLGLVYRSKVSHDFSGDATFAKPAGLPAGVASAAAATDTSAKIDLDLPESVYLTFQTALTEQVGVQAALTYTRWSRLKELRARLGNGGPDVVTPLNWKNTMRYSLGATYAVNDAWQLRAGVSYDESPANDTDRTPIIPDATNTTLALGASYKMTHDASLDVGYAHVFIDDAPIRLSTPSGGNLVGTFAKPHVDLLSVQYNQHF